VIQDAGLVSLEVARAMAVGVRRWAGPLSAWHTRNRGPRGGDAREAVGLVCVACLEGGEAGREFRLHGEREQVNTGCEMALEMLRRHLLASPWMRSRPGESCAPFRAVHHPMKFVKRLAAAQERLRASMPT